MIEGFDDFGAGKADSISGLSAPDDQTLVVKVTEPTGDLPWRFTMPATAPIPPNPADPEAASASPRVTPPTTGGSSSAPVPYMFEGSEQPRLLGAGEGPGARRRATCPAASIVLVRNPSYDPATDDLRPAYPDRIEATIGGDAADLFNKVEAGEVDYVADVATPPANVLQQYSTDPDLQPYLHTYQQNAVTYISMNLGVPPFDDVHVRKALNYRVRQGGWSGSSGVARSPG